MRRVLGLVALQMARFVLMLRLLAFPQDDLEEMVRKQPRLSEGASAADPLLGFLG